MLKCQEAEDLKGAQRSRSTKPRGMDGVTDRGWCAQTKFHRVEEEKRNS